jgi:hypothetical protein
MRCIRAVLTGIDGVLTCSPPSASGSPGALVKTGKYLPRTHRTASGTPGYVLDSFAGLPALPEQLSRQGQ